MYNFKIKIVKFRNYSLILTFFVFEKTNLSLHEGVEVVVSEQHRDFAVFQSLSQGGESVESQLGQRG